MVGSISWIISAFMILFVVATLGIVIYIYVKMGILSYFKSKTIEHTPQKLETLQKTFAEELNKEFNKLSEKLDALTNEIRQHRNERDK